jgi:hypothetical protein
MLPEVAGTKARLRYQSEQSESKNKGEASAKEDEEKHDKRTNGSKKKLTIKLPCVDKEPTTNREQTFGVKQAPCSGSPRKDFTIRLPALVDSIVATERRLRKSRESRVIQSAHVPDYGNESRQVPSAHAQDFQDSDVPKVAFSARVRFPEPGRLGSTTGMGTGDAADLNIGWNSSGMYYTKRRRRDHKHKHKKHNSFAREVKVRTDTQH